MNGSSVTADFFLLPPGQARVMAIVHRYVSALNEPCPSTYVARQLGKHHKTIQEHFAALYRKGWLAHGGSTAQPVRSYRSNRD